MSRQLTSGVLGRRKKGLLPADNTFAWYDAEKVTTAINEPVTFLEDRSGNGFDAIQNGVNPVPDLQVDANGNKCLRYIDDEVLYRALISNFGTAVAQPYTYFIVYTADVPDGSIVTTRGLIDGITSVSRSFIGYNSDRLAWSNGSILNNILLLLSYQRPVEKSIIQAESNFPDSNMYINDLHFYNDVVIGTQSIIGITIGSRFEGSPTGRAHIGNIYEIIMYDRLLTEQEKEQTYNYLKSKYNIAF